ncbi:DUF3053 family protein [Escherichia coli]
MLSKVLRWLRLQNCIQFPTSQQASEYNKLIAPLPAQHQAFNQAWTTAVTATQ